MSSTLSKFRTLARMVYPQYAEFERWLLELGAHRGGRRHFKIDNHAVYIIYDGAGIFLVSVDNARLNSMTLTMSKLEDQAIYVFWQAERYAKGDESLFAPKRREPGVVEQAK